VRFAAEGNVKDGTKLEVRPMVGTSFGLGLAAVAGPWVRAGRGERQADANRYCHYLVWARGGLCFTPVPPAARAPVWSQSFAGEAFRRAGKVL